MAQQVKNLPAMQETHRRHVFDPWLGKIPWKREGMTTHSSIHVWRTPWTEEPSGL